MLARIEVFSILPVILSSLDSCFSIIISRWKEIVSKLSSSENGICSFGLLPIKTHRSNDLFINTAIMLPAT